MGDIITDLFLKEEERQRRCLEEIKTILAKYNCYMAPKVTISAKGFQGDVEILPIVDPSKLTQG